MKRVNVTGNAGAGKSTVARELSKLLRTPLFGLDRVVWQPGWRPTPRAQRVAAEQAIAERAEWVVDGVSSVIREAADTIVFLDVPRRVSLWRCARRNRKYLFHSRPGLPPNCPEIRIAPKLLRIIWDFPAKARPRILADAQREEVQFVHLRSDEEVRRFIGMVVRRTVARGMEE